MAKATRPKVDYESGTGELSTICLNQYKGVLESLAKKIQYVRLPQSDWSVVVRYDKDHHGLCQDVLKSVLDEYEVPFKKPEDIEDVLSLINKESQKKFIGIIVDAVNKKIKKLGSESSSKDKRQEIMRAAIRDRPAKPKSISEERSQGTYEDRIAGNTEPSEDSAEYFMPREDE